MHILYMFPIMNVPFPLFPSRFSFPSFPARSSQWCLWLTRVPSSPSLCIPFPPPPFPLFPALFPYWRLCSRPLSYFRLCSFSLSLFSIMFLLPFPIFDYVPDNLCPWCPMLLAQIVESAICIKCLSEQARQLLAMHRIMFQIPTLFSMQKSPF